ncbi:MAG: helix-turn-helix domain-containing protein [Acidimicrobiales bacterium]
MSAGGHPKDHTITTEFLVEPFAEGSPGSHVQVALDCFANAGLKVDMGPFSNSTTGAIDATADAVAQMIRSSMRSGATAIRIQVGEQQSDLDRLGSLEHALDQMVRSAERDLGTNADEWDRSQKQAVVRMLDERGAFLLRGAVDDIAKIMGVSRITIYNYLSAIEER